MTEYKLLLIDDDQELTELLTEYLSSQGLNITVAHDGEAGLNKANATQFDLILLDVMLPKMDGFEVLKQLRTTNKTPVLMLTARGDDFDRIFGLELGADDYLPKPFNHRELVARIKAITRRIEHIASVQHQSELFFNDVRLDLSSRQVTCAGNEVLLTGTEFQMLHLLMSSPGEIVSKEVISQEVLGRRLAPFDRSIDMHLSNIRKKLQQFCDDDKLKTVRGAGYIFIKGARQ
ncbi:MAG: response regulator [Algicola sp.]|nr:response regulator [Algicola sp.]